VLAVSVTLNSHIIIVVAGKFEPRLHSSTNAKIIGKINQMDAAINRSHFMSLFSGGVIGAVIDNHHVYRRVVLSYVLDHTNNALFLVVGRNNNEDFWFFSSHLMLQN